MPTFASTASTFAGAASTSGLQHWIRSNIIPLLILVIAVMLFAIAQRGDNARAMKVVAGVVIALTVLGLAVGGNAENLGTFFAGLVTG